MSIVRTKFNVERKNSSLRLKKISYRLLKTVRLTWFYKLRSGGSPRRQKAQGNVLQDNLSVVHALTVLTALTALTVLTVDMCH